MKNVFIPSAKVDNMPPFGTAPPKCLLHGYSLKKTTGDFLPLSQSSCRVGVVMTFDLWAQEGPAFSRGLSGYWQRSDMIDRLMLPPSSEGPLCLSGSDVFPELTSQCDPDKFWASVKRERNTGEARLVTGFPYRHQEIKPPSKSCTRMSHYGLCCVRCCSTPPVCSRRASQMREFSVSVEHVGVGRCWIFIWIISVFFSSEVGHRRFHRNKRHRANLSRQDFLIIIWFPVIRLFKRSHKQPQFPPHAAGTGLHPLRFITRFSPNYQIHQGGYVTVGICCWQITSSKDQSQGAKPTNWCITVLLLLLYIYYIGCHRMWGK